MAKKVLILSSSPRRGGNSDVLCDEFMKDAVVIKGNKAGMTVYLEKDLDFDEVLQAIAKKFKATAKFWGAAQMTLTLEGRDLTPEEEYRVVQTITDNSDIEVLCLLDTDGNRTKKCEKALNERLMELSSLTGQFYKGNLRDGDELELVKAGKAIRLALFTENKSFEWPAWEVLMGLFFSTY